MVESLKPAEPEPADEELLPTWDAPGAAEATPLPPALPVAAAAPAAPAPVEEAPVAIAPVIPLALPPCPICDSPRSAGRSHCDSCGYIFPADDGRAAPPPAAIAANSVLRERYEVMERIGERCGVERLRGIDRISGSPIVVVRQALPPMAEDVPALEAVPVAEEVPAAEPSTDEDIVLGFDDAMAVTQPMTGPPMNGPAFPSPAWEEQVLSAAKHPFLPQVVDSFAEDGFEYTIEELPIGQSLWDAWDDPEATMEQRFGWLKHVAEQVRALHTAGAMPETLRPDGVIITSDGRGRLADLSALLPIPVPPDAPIRGSLYTAPELAAHNGKADPRANLYSFGALLYSLHVGRELTEMDFDRPGNPKAFIPRFPDVHPAFGRLMMKTFTREVSARFPTDEALKDDPTGFTELIRTLEVCSRTLDNVRMEIAAWTTTGMVRTGNEDAFALLHACESRQDDVGECALLLLADGMGGYDAGEVAAALAIQHLRRILLAQRPFAALAGASTFPTEVPRAEGNAPVPLRVDEAKALLRSA